MLKRIDHIGVVVDDLEEARRFLGESLGLELVRTLELPEKHLHAAFYRCGECLIEAIEVHDPDSRRERLGDGNRARIEHIAIEVDDLRTTLRALEGLGVRTDAAPLPIGRNLNVWTLPETTDGVQYQFLEKDAVTTT